MGSSHGVLNRGKRGDADLSEECILDICKSTKMTRDQVLECYKQFLVSLLRIGIVYLNIKCGIHLI